MHDIRETTAVVALSGGLDSATVLALALSQKEKCCGVGFTYGSKHNRYENNAAEELASYYNIPFQLINIEGVIISESALLQNNNKDIPEGHYQSENMKQTIVPGRNLIFISILASYAEAIDANDIWLGIHAGDHFIYPDCRPEFFYAANNVVVESTEGKISLHAPFLDESKVYIIERGLELGVPYNLTRTCYKNQPLACGKCGSCVERLEAFAAIDKTDPINYEERISS